MIKQNSLIEIGSKANVVLRFNTPVSLNGQEYKAKEPYLFLKDVNVIINYSNKDAVANTDINLMAYSNIKPRRVTIGGVNFSRKLASLLACYKESSSLFKTTSFLTATADEMEFEGIVNGIVFLLDDNFELDENLFVYDDEFNVIEDVLYDENLNALYSVNIEKDKNYLISFSSVRAGTKFNLNKPHIPYMSLEIQGVGNIDKQTKKVLMYFDKVSLSSILEFTFIQGAMINIPLEFYIIDDKNNYVVFEE